MSWLDKALRRGARRLHDALLSRTAVERAARALFAHFSTEGHPTWNSITPYMQGGYRSAVRTALTTAIEKGETDE